MKYTCATDDLPVIDLEGQTSQMGLSFHLKLCLIIWIGARL